MNLFIKSNSIVQVLSFKRELDKSVETSFTKVLYYSFYYINNDLSKKLYLENLQNIIVYYLNMIYFYIWVLFCSFIYEYFQPGWLTACVFKMFLRISETLIQENISPWKFQRKLAAANLVQKMTSLVATRWRLITFLRNQIPFMSFNSKDM